MFLVKLGGSVITDKARTRTFRADIAERLAKELAEASMSGVLVTGAGSFGHILAKKYKLNQGIIDCSLDQIQGLSHVQRDVRLLNLKVCDALLKKKLSPVSMPPSAMVRCKGGKIESIDLKFFKLYLKLGTIPVTFGDVVLDSTSGFCICSGDLMMEVLSKNFKFDFAVFVTDVDGVFDADPKMDPSANLIKEFSIGKRPMGDAQLSNEECNSSVNDVTGKMRGKIACALNIASTGTDVYIINGLVPGRLKALLSGKDVVCTKINAYGTHKNRNESDTKKGTKARISDIK